MGFVSLSPSYNSASGSTGTRGSLAPPIRNRLSRCLKLLGAFVVVENSVAPGRCLINHFAANVGAFDREMAVPEAQVTRFFVADERVVLFRAGKARPLQSDDHRP